MERNASSGVVYGGAKLREDWKPVLEAERRRCGMSRVSRDLEAERELDLP
jgi:hypothetical protein